MASSSGSSPFPVPASDLGKFLHGTWKRNLEWIDFDPGFEFVRNLNSIVKIEVIDNPARDPNLTVIQWQFGTLFSSKKVGDFKLEAQTFFVIKKFGQTEETF